MIPNLTAFLCHVTLDEKLSFWSVRDEEKPVTGQRDSRQAPGDSAEKWRFGNPKGQGRPKTCESHGRAELCSRQKTLNRFEVPLANLTSFGSISDPSFNVVRRFRWLAFQLVSHGFDLAHFEVLGPQSFVSRTAQMATYFHAVLGGFAYNSGRGNHDSS